MSVSTRSRRASALGLYARWIVVPPFPDGALELRDRTHTAASYSRLENLAATVTIRYAAMTAARAWPVGAMTHQVGIYGAMTTQRSAQAAMTNAQPATLAATINAV